MCLTKTKKIIVICGVIVMALFFGGCSSGMNRIQEEKALVKDVAVDLLGVIAQKDRDKLKAFFSDTAYSSADFEIGMDYVFDIFTGKIQSVENKGTHVQDYWNAGSHTKLAIGLYEVITDANSYMLYFEYYQKHDVYRDKMIRLKLIVKEDTQETGAFSNHGGMGDKIGIYYPS